MSYKSTTSSTISVDDEWENFLNKPDEEDEYENYESTCSHYGDSTSDTTSGFQDEDSDAEYDNEFMINRNNEYEDNNYLTLSDLTSNSSLAPTASDIYISTKSKISYLNREIDIRNIFWKIPIIPYSKPENGIIKKQIKFNSNTEEELNIIKEKLQHEVYSQEQIITNINNPTGRIKFKDIRKISVGISKKDIMNHRAKKKSVFYNCFVIILRLKVDNIFKEYHIKVFNTGKLEIPGVQNDIIFKEILSIIITILQPHIEDEPLLDYQKKSDTILINSNFNCGFYINREDLVDILKFKYNVHCIYDPTSYPGIQCKFYYDPIAKTHTSAGSQQMRKSKDIIEVSFMIFRTGSVLIVGMCEEYVLHIIYAFLTKILITEYHKICQKNSGEFIIAKKKEKKVRRKNIIVSILPTITEDTEQEEAEST